MAIDWRDLLIRENKTPGSIATQTITTPRDHRQIRNFIESFESAENDIANNQEISDNNVERLVRFNSIDLDNISRILQALKDKYEESPLIVLSQRFNTLLDNFTNDVETYDELAKFIEEEIENIDNKKSNWRMDFQQRINYTNKEELLQNLETVMKKGNIDGTIINQLIRLLPDITHQSIRAERTSRQNITTEINYTVGPIERFKEVLQEQITFDKFNDLFRYLVNEKWLTPIEFYSFYISGSQQGQFDVRSPMYTLFKILQFKDRQDIFSVAIEGAIMGRKEQVGGTQAKTFRLFISDYLSGKTKAVTKEESERYKLLNYEDRITMEDEKIQRINLPKTDPTSLKPAYDKWLEGHKAFMGTYAKTQEDFKDMYKERFYNNIDKGSIFTLCIPHVESEGTVELTNFLTDGQWPSNISESSPKMILKAYLYIIDNFSKLGHSNVQIENLLQKLRTICNDITEIEYEVERDEGPEKRKLFARNKKGKLTLSQTKIEGIIGLDNINKLIEAFITEFKEAINATSEGICKSIHSAVERNIGKRSISKYTILSRTEPKLVRDEKRVDGKLVTGKIKEEKDDKGNPVTISRKEGTFQEWIEDIGDKATPLILRRSR